MGTAGANGRNSSRYLMERFSRSRIAGSCGAARMLRLPSARAELAGALHPPDDATLRELLGDPPQQLRLGKAFRFQAILCGDARQLTAVNHRPPIGMIGDRGLRAPEMDPVGVERRPQCAS